MKKLILFFVPIFLMSCNPGGGSTSTSTKDSSASSSKAPLDYPYTKTNKAEWAIGNPENSLKALKALKAWEIGKIDESMQYFADTVQIQFDALDKKMPKDSLKKFFTAGWNSMKNVKITLSDFEAVESTDKTQEWVTMWYRQLSESKTGVKDSVEIVNDVRFKNGKVVRLDEYTRKLH